MMSGCYELEVLLRTTLQCFYDQDCIDSNRIFMKLNTTSLALSRFGLNATIRSILNNLMVEEYASNLSYKSYFDECAPLSCPYSSVKSHDVTETTLSLMSLYGGLVILTQCLAVIIYVSSHISN